MSGKDADKDVIRLRIDDKFINELRLQAASPSQGSYAGVKNTAPIPIDDKIKAERQRRQQIDNDNAEKDQKLKEETLSKLFAFLKWETIAIFAIATLQGFGSVVHFKLDGLSFRILVGATIGQITAMLVIAVQHLYPKKRK